MRESKLKTNQIDYDFNGHGGGAESITLLSITTAPQAPFKAGDRFYSNEETEQFDANVIYKAVVDNSWEYAEALSPELGVFYIFDGETYLYDAKIESLFKIGDSTSSNELYILNKTLAANTTTLNTEVDFSENFLINVYVNGLLQSKDLHYYVSGTNIIFTSTFEEAVNVIILYTSSSDVNINNTPTGTVNYNELINKPQINGVTLSGNKTTADLNIPVFEDGIYHPKNGDELYDIFENEPGWSKTIDFSNFDFSTFYEDGYTINEKAFTIRNFSMGSDWGARQFNWLKSPLFTLNNGATLYFQKFVVDISNVHHDAGDGQEAANNAPVIRVNNGSYVSIVDGGMININNVTGIDKYVAIELNNSNIYIQNFGIIINSYDMRRPEGIDSLTCGILCNGFSYGENNFDRVGFEINGNTTEKYGIKYNDDLGGFIKIHGCSFIVDDGNGYSIYCSNKTILELNFANVGKIDGMAITVKQLSPNTDYYRDDIIEINNKLYQVTQDFNSNDYNDIEDGYGQVYEDFWTINVTGTMYSIEDPNGRIGSYETMDDGYRVNSLILNTENWNLPISDEHLTATNAQDAIKELAASGGSLPDQTGQAGKFLTTNGTNASWAEVQGGSSSATITYFDSTNWTLDITNTILSTGLNLGNKVNVFKNGQLIEPGASNDYTISGNNIVFTEPLTSTDKVAVINGNMNPMQSVGYNTFSNKSILATDWVADNTYTGYSYKCDILCTGVTSTMYAQVTFAPEEAMSGNYANICDTGTGIVTIYSKVAEAITIPMIMVLGV